MARTAAPPPSPGDAELGDHVPDRPGPDAPDDPPAGQRGQGGERARQYGRGAAGQVGDGDHARDAFGLAEQEPGQRVRVQLVAEVRVVGHGEQVQAVPVGLGTEPDAPGRVGGIRAVPLAQRGTEQDIVSGHQQSFRRSSLDTSTTTRHHAAVRSARLRLRRVAVTAVTLVVG
jgi:hypothetical protein